MTLFTINPNLIPKSSKICFLRGKDVGSRALWIRLWRFIFLQLHIKWGPGKQPMISTEHDAKCSDQLPIQCSPLNSPSFLSPLHLLSKWHQWTSQQSRALTIYNLLPPPHWLFPFYVSCLDITYSLLLNICFRKKKNERRGQIYKECSWRGGGLIIQHPLPL